MAQKNGVLTTALDLAALYGGYFVGRLAVGHPDCARNSGGSSAETTEILDNDGDCATGLLSLSQAVGTLPERKVAPTVTRPTETAQPKG